MTNLDLNSRIANVLSVAESGLRAILLEATRDLGGEVTVTVDDGMVGKVIAATGSVTINGAPVGNVVHLLSLLVAVEQLTANAKAPAAVAPDVASDIAAHHATVVAEEAAAVAATHHVG
jgi:hypothetical protein